MTKVVFSHQAKQDLQEIGDYIAIQLRNKSAARNLIDGIRKTVSVLQQFPAAGTQLKDTGLKPIYRYLICGNYMIFYHLSDCNACIDRILYGRSDYLSLLFGNEIESE